jgi:hypothetical protein
MLQRSPALVAVYRRRKANDSPACRITQSWYRDRAMLRHREKSENCIRAGQPGPGVRRSGTGRAPTPLGAVRANSHYSDMFLRLFSPGEWRNGRRAGFRCQCPSGRGGSSPPSPTTAVLRTAGIEVTNCTRGRDLCVLCSRTNASERRRHDGGLHTHAGQIPHDQFGVHQFRRIVLNNRDFCEGVRTLRPTPRHAADNLPCSASRPPMPIDRTPSGSSAESIGRTRGAVSLYRCLW